MPKESEDIICEDIALHPNMAETVAGWIEHQWSTLPIVRSLRDPNSVVRREGKELPRTFVALRPQGNLVGTASILYDDLEARKDLNPWFGCLWVDPKYRNRGIGAALVHHSIQVASTIGLGGLYLFAEPNLLEYYGNLGWNFLAESSEEGHPVVVMTIKT